MTRLRDSRRNPVNLAFNMHTRIGEIFSRRRTSGDLRQGIPTVFGSKTEKTREVPINFETRTVLEPWSLGKKNAIVFYNPETSFTSAGPVSQGQVIAIICTFVGRL